MISKILLIIIFVLNMAGASEVFVDSSAQGDNSGTNWKSAFVNLQEAFKHAGEGDTVCIAQGTYYPDTVTTHNAGFIICPGITVLGGFKKGGMKRDSKLYKTILSGDMNRDDVISGDSIKNNENNTYHVIVCEGAKSISLDGLTITGGYSSGYDKNKKKIKGYGGGLYIHIWNRDNTAALYMSNCEIRDNRSNQYGAGLFFQGSLCEVHNCKFENNKTENTGEILTQIGGGMFIESFSATLDSLTVNNNSAVCGGGIAYNGVNINLKKVTMIANSSSGGGGAIWFSGENMDAEDIECNENYSTGGKGGVLLFRGRNLFVSGMKASKNSASGIGGVIDFQGDSAVLNKVEFMDNTSGESGGVMRFLGKDLVLKRSLFNNNTAQRTSGGVVIFEGYVCSITGCRFNNNSAPLSGGAIVFRGSAMTCDSSWFAENSSKNGYGSAIDFQGDICSIQSSTFKDNSAPKGKSGAICFRGKCFHVRNSTFNANSAINGGAVDFEGDSCLIAASTFSGNSANGKGGALNLTGKVFQINKVKFEQNSAENGGAVFCDHDINKIPGDSIYYSGLCMEDVQFKGNTASKSGGAISWMGAGKINNSEFTNNIAPKGSAVNGWTHESGSRILFRGDSVLVDSIRIAQEKAVAGTSSISKSVFSCSTSSDCISSGWAGKSESCRFPSNKAINGKQLITRNSKGE
jgi:predicted outer membrane repeat protein